MIQMKINVNKVKYFVTHIVINANRRNQFRKRGEEVGMHVD